MTGESAGRLGAGRELVAAQSEQICARWKQLAVYMAFATLAALLVLELVPGLLSAPRATALFEQGLARGVLRSGSIALALGVLILLRTGWGRLRAFFGLRHFFSYPPIWVAGIMAVATSLVVVGLQRSIVNSPTARIPAGDFVRSAAGIFFELALVGAGVWGVLIGACALAILAWRRRHKHVGVASSVSGPVTSQLAVSTVDAESHSDLVAWIKADEPLSSATEDRFGRLPIARRIASRLCMERGSSQAVVGELGSGKTSLGRLVEDVLRREFPDSRVLMVFTSLWPYETVSAAVEGVIGALLDKLGQEVPLVGLRAVPQHYVRAIVSAGGTWPSGLGLWSALVHAVTRPAPPAALLASIDAVATAIGIRFVVWVDDLERFAPVPARRGLDQERLRPIRALLHSMDQLTSVQVITASASLDGRFDVDKIARYIERLPGFPETELRSLLIRYRQQWRSAKHIIDPATPEVRRAMREYEHGLSEGRWQLGLPREGVGDLVEALMGFCRTPRSLKRALRECQEVWESMPGEIDMDDVLAMSLLKQGLPSAFDLLVDRLANPPIDFVPAGTEQKSGEQLWEEAVARLRISEFHRKCLAELAEFVFDKSGHKPQGLAARGHADYLRRYLAVAPPAVHESDQVVLKALKNGDEEAIVDVLTTCGDAVYDFRALLSADQERSLLVPLIQRRASEPPDSWSGGVPGLVPLWRMWMRRLKKSRPPNDEMVDALKEAMRFAAARNLWLAAELDHLFVSAEEFSKNMNGRQHEVRRTLHDMLLEQYAGHGRRLVDALRGAPAYTLLWLCFGLDNVRADSRGETLVPFERWTGLISALFEALRETPGIMLPQIAALIVITSDLSDGGRVQRVSEPRIQALFDDRAKDELMTLLANTSPGSDTSHAVLVACEYARQQVASAER